MDAIQKSDIYDRLLKITMTIDPNPVPSPVYINNAIFQCHKYIEEVESLHIRLTKEMSIIQQALNNSEAEYKTKLESLISSESIKDLPGIRDKEARANKSLQEELNRITSYKNELSDLNNLLRAIDLKLKNLNRVNSDIRLQVRVLESQIKLNALPEADPVATSLASEMRKSSVGEDSFKEATSSAEQAEITDPTEPLDVNSLLENPLTTVNNLPRTAEDVLPQPSVDPVMLEPVPEVELGEEESTEEEPLELSPDTEGASDSASVVVDLDNVIEEDNKKGTEGGKPPPVIENQIQKQSEQQKKTDSPDLDSLLDAIITNEKRS